MQLLSNNIVNINDLSGAFKKFELNGYAAWDHNCTFELEFPKSSLTRINFNLNHVLLYSITIEGIIKLCANKAPSVFEVAVSCSSELSMLGEYNVFSFGSYFERKDVRQTKHYPSSAHVICCMGKASFDFIYRGKEGEPYPEIVNTAKVLIAACSAVNTGSVTASWWSIKAELKDTDNEVVGLLDSLINRVGSGRVYEHTWSASIMGVHDEDVNKFGFELYNRVAESGLTADKIQVNFKLQFLDIRGVKVVRHLCEGKTNYTIPLGTFRHRKKKAILGVFTNKDGHRLSLTLKDSPTEEEWQYLENTLATTFERKPFVTMNPVA